MKKKALLILSALVLALWPALSHAVELRGYDSELGYEYVALGRCPQDEDGGVRDIIWRVLEHLRSNPNHCSPIRYPTIQPGQQRKPVCHL